MSEEKLDFSRSFVVLGNLALFAWVVLASVSIWLYNVVYGWVFFAFTAAMVYMILRRLGCSSCYYCKSCTSGFGRLAGAFFGRGYLRNGSVGNRRLLVGFIYVLLAPIPVAVLVVSLMQSVNVFEAAVLVCLLALTAYSLGTWLRK
ncbi:MAG: hypothetical protein NWF04_10030 [Candidatus Bathyarchaeota archaeon]|nr:hypothetical protein [Candidatus Bathyarchaeota archaeon]